MQVFNAFMKVLKKKIFIVLIYVWIFAAVGIAISISDSSNSQFEQTALKICVFDEDNTPASASLCRFLDRDNDLVTLENDRDIIIDALYYGRTDYVLTIKSGYAGKLASGDTNDLFETMKMHDSYSTVYMGQILNEYIGTVSAFMAGGSDVVTSAEKAADTLSKKAEVNTVSFGEASDGVLTNGTAMFFRYLAYVILGAVMNTLCPVLLILGKKDIRFRTNCSGLPRSSYTLQIFAASTVFIIGIWAVFILIGMLVNGGLFTGLAWLAVLNSFVFTLFSAAVTIFMASFEPGKNLINIITQIVTISSGFLCGVFIQQDLLGEGVLAAARFLPTYWYIRVNRMLAGEEPFDSGLAATSILIVAGFAAVFAVLTVLVRNTKYSAAKVRTA